VVAAIADKRPDMVFAPHVETASGMILPDAYLRAVADATHAVAALRAGLRRVRRDLGRHGRHRRRRPDQRPQKGWSSSPCCAS